MNEYRMVCSHFGEDFHQLHKWLKGNVHIAKQGVIDANHKAEQNPEGFYNKACAPYRVQQREIVEWSDAE